MHFAAAAMQDAAGRRPLASLTLERSGSHHMRCDGITHLTVVWTAPIFDLCSTNRTGPVNFGSAVLDRRSLTRSSDRRRARSPRVLSLASAYMETAVTVASGA